MANNFYAANILTGGGAGSLDDIDHSVLTDDDLCMTVVATTALVYFHVYDSGSAAVDDGVDYITPTSAAGDERWVLTHLQSFSDFFRDSAKATDLDEFYTGLGLKYDHMWLGAGAWNANETSGAGFGGEEFATNDVTVSYYGFDDTTKEYIEFDIVMPPTWNRGTIKVKFYWLSTSDATAGEKVRWGLAGGSYSNVEEMDAAMGTLKEVSDTLAAGEEEMLHISPATAAITIAGAAALGDVIHLKAHRDPDHADDDLVGDANLLGIVVEFANTNEVVAWA